MDRAKIEVIEEKLPPPTIVKGIRSFIGHARFHRRFIKDFCKITKQLWNLLEMDETFKFDAACLQAFEQLKVKLITTSIVPNLDLSLPFELMFDASYYAIGAVLGQHLNMVFHTIYYPSKTLS